MMGKLKWYPTGKILKKTGQLHRWFQTRPREKRMDKCDRYTEKKIRNGIYVGG